jgi:hypothetical protein
MNTRMMGAPNRGDQIMNPNKAKLLLEDLILGKGPDGGCWPDDMLGDWVNDPDIGRSISVEIKFYDFASLTSGTSPRLEVSSKAYGEIDDNWFSIGIPREEPSAPLSPMDANTLWSHDFRPVLDHLLFDQEMTTLRCRVNSKLLLPNYIIYMIMNH